MSQSGIFFDNTGPGGVIQYLTGDVGGPIHPALGNVNILGGVNITATGTPLAHTLTLDLASTITVQQLNIDSMAGFTGSQSSQIQDAIQTVGAVPAALISLDVADGQMLTVKAYINGFKSTKDQCLGGEIFATFYRPTGGNVTMAGLEVSNVVTTSSADLDAVVSVGTQTARINVVGVNLETWNWVTTYSYMYLISEL